MASANSESTDNKHQFIIRQARRSDSKAIHDMIVELAVFEKEPDAVLNTPEGLEIDGFWADDEPTRTSSTGFNMQPCFQAWVAETADDHLPMAYAIVYICYSTWEGPASISRVSLSLRLCVCRRSMPLHRRYLCQARVSRKRSWNISLSSLH